MDMAMPMALYTSAISLAWIYADIIPPLAVLALALLAGGPLLLYRMQRRLFNDSDGKLGVAELWRMGIITIFLGTIFTLMVTYGVLEYVRPSYIYDQIQIVIETYKHVPEMKDSELVEALEYMTENNMAPSAFDYALNMFLLTNTSGMAMGALTAVYAAKSHRNNY